AALAPDADETSQSLLDKFATTPVFGHIEVTDGPRLAQAKRCCALRGRPARGGAEANLRDAGGARGRPLQPKGRGHGVEVQAELLCPRHGGPDGSPGSATLRLKTHEGCHDRSRVFARPHVVEARSGARCHPQGRWRGLNVLT